MVFWSLISIQWYIGLIFEKNIRENIQLYYRNIINIKIIKNIKQISIKLVSMDIEQYFKSY